MSAAVTKSKLPSSGSISHRPNAAAGHRPTAVSSAAEVSSSRSLTNDSGCVSTKSGKSTSTGSGSVSARGNTGVTRVIPVEIKRSTSKTENPSAATKTTASGESAVKSSASRASVTTGSTVTRSLTVTAIKHAAVKSAASSRRSSAASLPSSDPPESEIPSAVPEPGSDGSLKATVVRSSSNRSNVSTSSSRSVRSSASAASKPEGSRRSSAGSGPSTEPSRLLRKKSETGVIGIGPPLSERCNDAQVAPDRKIPKSTTAGGEVKRTAIPSGKSKVVNVVQVHPSVVKGRKVESTQEKREPPSGSISARSSQFHSKAIKSSTVAAGTKTSRLAVRRPSSARSVTDRENHRRSVTSTASSCSPAASVEGELEQLCSAAPEAPKKLDPNVGAVESDSHPLFNVERSSMDDISRIVDDTLENVSDCCSLSTVDETLQVSADSETVGVDDIELQTRTSNSSDDPGNEIGSTSLEVNLSDPQALDFSACERERVPDRNREVSPFRCIEEEDGELVSVRSCMSSVESLPDTGGYSTPCADDGLVENATDGASERVINVMSGDSVDAACEEPAAVDDDETFQSLENFHSAECSLNFTKIDTELVPDDTSCDFPPSKSIEASTAVTIATGASEMECDVFQMEMKNVETRANDVGAVERTSAETTLVSLNVTTSPEDVCGVESSPTICVSDVKSDSDVVDLMLDVPYENASLDNVTQTVGDSAPRDGPQSCELHVSESVSLPTDTGSSVDGPAIVTVAVVTAASCSSSSVDNRACLQSVCSSSETELSHSQRSSSLPPPTLLSTTRAASASPSPSAKGSTKHLILNSDIPPINVVKTRPVAAREYFNVNPVLLRSKDRVVDSTESLNGGKSVVAKVAEDANHNVLVKNSCSTSEATAAPVPAVSSLPVVTLSSCTRVANTALQYVPSRRPLSQIYGITDMEDDTLGDGTAVSRSHAALAALPTRHSYIFTQPTSSITGDTPLAEDISFKIKLARSCSRNGISQHVAAASDDLSRRRAESFRGLLRMTDSRSIENFRSPGLGIGINPLSHASSVRNSLVRAVSPSHTPTASQNCSPTGTPTVSRCSSGILSSGGSTLRNDGTMTPGSTLMGDDDLRSSLASLASISSSVYSNVEDRQTIEIRKLRRELDVANEKIESLSAQFNVNSFMVSSYEQNLESLTKKLKGVTNLLELKDTELAELRANSKNRSSTDIDLETIPDSSSLQSFRRTASNASSTLPNELRASGCKSANLSRHISCESVNSINSQSSSCSMTSQQSGMTYGGDKKKHKKKSWIKNSIVKAFSRKKSGGKLDTASVGEGDSTSIHSDVSGTDSAMDGMYTPAIRTADCLVDRAPLFHDVSKTCELEDQLHERDVELTESRLESLASYHLIHQLQENVADLEKEVAALKNENRSLRRLLLSQGTNISNDALLSQSSRGDGHGVMALRQRVTTTPRTADARLSLNDPLSAGRTLPGSRLSQKFSLSDLAAADFEDTTDCIHRLKVTFSPGEFSEMNSVTERQDRHLTCVGELSLMRSTTWKALDTMVCDVFTEYIEQLDPGTHLGLDTQSLLGYQLADVTRTFNSEPSDTLPATCVSDTCSVLLIVKGWRENSVDALVLDTLVPKHLLRQYVSLALECRRLVICGPSGSGKTYLAHKLANHIMLRCNKSPSPDAISTFVVDSKSVGELQQYVTRLVRSCHDDPGVNNDSSLPTVLLVDNLQYISSLSDVLGTFVATKSTVCPYFIGTMNQTRKPSTADLQLRQNFRWVLLSPPLDPVAGLLARFLRRALIHRTVEEGGVEKVAVLRNVLDWLPRLWQHVNKSAVALSSSSTACIGPALFLTCPVDVEKSRNWFIDVWNNSIMPYLVQLNKDDCKSASSGMTRSRIAPEDPTSWVLESFPWPKDSSPSGSKINPPLVRLKPDCDTIIANGNSHLAATGGTSNRSRHSSSGSNTEDRVFAMLLKLQEVTNNISSPGGPLSTTTTNGNPTTQADLDYCRYGNGTSTLNAALATVHSAVS